jgi:hypothetical protein
MGVAANFVARPRNGGRVNTLDRLIAEKIIKELHFLKSGHVQTSFLQKTGDLFSEMLFS